MTPAAAVPRREEHRGHHVTAYRMRAASRGGEGHARGVDAHKPLAMSMKMTRPARAPGQVEIRLVDGAMYIGGAPRAAKEMDGKSWLKFDLSAWPTTEGAGRSAPARPTRTRPPSPRSSPAPRT